jgi:transglutaminase-like putative cysteine protease
MRRLPIPVAPAEGWLSLALVAVMTTTAAWAIDDAGWVLGRTDWTDFLVWAGLLGVAAGFVGSKTGSNRWLAHLLGAAFAALIVPVLVGSVLENGATPGVQFEATAAACVRAWSDLVVHALPATRATGHHLLILGLILWATGQFAASAVFRHHRPLSAAIVIGALLIGNMWATVRDQLGYLILFSLASLFLLIRLHALDEQATWLRRRIGDPAAVGSIYLRGGTVFILIAVLGSLTLTATARSAPLAGAWEDLKPWLLDVSTAIQRFLPTGIDSRGLGGVQFGPDALIHNVWSTSDTLALTIRRKPGDERNYYWRAVAYDHFNLYGWDWTQSARSPRPADEELLLGTLDALPPEVGEEVTFRVTPGEYRNSYVLSPLAPLKVDRDTSLIALGDEGFFEAIEINGRDPYTVTARIPILGDDGGITENLLRVAGDDYPDAIADRFLEVPPGAIGEKAREVLDDVLAKAPAANPYDIAKTLVQEFHSARFTYDTNVLDVDCGERSASECFAWSKRGYCQHYATLMTILLRDRGIPARFVQGFLPGLLDPRSGTEIIRNTNAHAWVEAYFPGYGWVLFDPTGGEHPAPEPLPSGRPVASRPPGASPSFSSRDPNDQEGPDVRRSPGLLPPGGTSSGPGAGPFIVVAVLLVLAFAVVAFLAWQRGPRGPTTPEGVYAGMTRLASRLGFGPRPTQTAYEYAAALGDILPSVRPELQTVATAKVEVAYGRMTLGDDRIRALRESYRRLRVSLLRLVFRRGRRGPKVLRRP